jgi:hypothetical protein
MSRPLSGFLHTDVTNVIECPECHQPPGMSCQAHKGKKLSTPHPVRTTAYLQKFPDRIDLYRDSADRVDRTLLYNQRLLSKASRSRS